MDIYGTYENLGMQPPSSPTWLVPIRNICLRPKLVQIYKNSGVWGASGYMLQICDAHIKSREVYDSCKFWRLVLNMWVQAPNANGKYRIIWHWINIGNNTAEACIFRLPGVRHVNTLCLSWHKVIKPSEKPMEHRRVVRNPRLFGEKHGIHLRPCWQQKDVLKKQPERLYMFIQF